MDTGLQWSAGSWTVDGGQRARTADSETRYQSAGLGLWVLDAVAGSKDSKARFERVGPTVAFGDLRCIASPSEYPLLSYPPCSMLSI